MTPKLLLLHTLVGFTKALSAGSWAVASRSSNIEIGLLPFPVSEALLPGETKVRPCATPWPAHWQAALPPPAPASRPLSTTRTALYSTARDFTGVTRRYQG